MVKHSDVSLKFGKTSLRDEAFSCCSNNQSNNLDKSRLLKKTIKIDIVCTAEVKGTMPISSYFVVGENCNNIRKQRTISC